MVSFPYLLVASSYDLDVGGHVKDTYTGEYIAGQISTPAGSTIVNNNAYFNCDELNFREKWAQTDNCIGKLLYGMANDIFVTAQIFDFGNLDFHQYYKIELQHL